MDEYIKIEDLIDRGLYKIEARNASAGIWVADKQYFLIRKYSFGDIYGFTEDHWDVDDRGTAQPLELIEVLPDDFNIKDDNAVLNILEEYIDLE